MAKAAQRPMWRCPKCGRAFVTRNVEHACKLRPVDEHFRGKAPEVRAAYAKLEKLVRRHGPFDVHAFKTGIAFRGRIGFIYLRVLRDRIDADFVLPKVVRHPRIHKIQVQSARAYHHHLTLRSPRDVDKQTAAWVREAYRVGQQLHLKEPASRDAIAEFAAQQAAPRATPHLRKRPLWRCPKCGKHYVTRNISHACARHTEAEHFRGKSEMVTWLYRRVLKILRGCGLLRLNPDKTRIAFQVRMRFAGVQLCKDKLKLGFLLARLVEHPRICGVDYYTPRCIGHHLELRGPEDLDAQLEAWLRESYRVGAQAHLLKK